MSLRRFTLPEIPLCKFYQFSSNSTTSVISQCIVLAWAHVKFHFAIETRVTPFPYYPNNNYHYCILCKPEPLGVSALLAHHARIIKLPLSPPWRFALRLRPSVALTLDWNQFHYFRKLQFPLGTTFNQSLTQCMQAPNFTEY